MRFERDLLDVKDFFKSQRFVEACILIAVSSIVSSEIVEIVLYAILIQFNYSLLHSKLNNFPNMQNQLNFSSSFPTMSKHLLPSMTLFSSFLFNSKQHRKKSINNALRHRYYNFSIQKNIFSVFLVFILTLLHNSRLPGEYFSKE